MRVTFQHCSRTKTFACTIDSKRSGTGVLLTSNPIDIPDDEHAMAALLYIDSKGNRYDHVPLDHA